MQSKRIGILPEFVPWGAPIAWEPAPDEPERPPLPEASDEPQRSAAPEQLGFDVHKIAVCDDSDTDVEVLESILDNFRQYAFTYEVHSRDSTAAYDYNSPDCPVSRLRRTRRSRETEKATWL